MATKGRFMFLGDPITMLTSSTAHYSFPEANATGGLIYRRGNAVLPFAGRIKNLLINTGGGTPIGSGFIDLIQMPNGVETGGYLFSDSFNQLTDGVLEFPMDVAVSRGMAFGFRLRGDLCIFSVSMEIEYDLVE